MHKSATTTPQAGRVLRTFIAPGEETGQNPQLYKPREAPTTNGYWPTKLERLTYTLSDAEFLSSRVEVAEAALHTPLLDIDGDNIVTQLPTGPCFWTAPGATRENAKAIELAFAAAGLAASPTHARAARHAVPELHSQHLLERETFAAYREANPAAEWDNLVDGVSWLTEATAPTAQTLEGRVAIPFTANSWMVTSTRNRHLVIEEPVTMDAYRALLDGLVAAAVIEPGYAQAVSDQEMGSLRLPWIEKHPVAQVVDPWAA